MENCQILKIDALEINEQKSIWWKHSFWTWDLPLWPNDIFKHIVDFYRLKRETKALLQFLEHGTRFWNLSILIKVDKWLMTNIIMVVLSKPKKKILQQYSTFNTCNLIQSNMLVRKLQNKCWHYFTPKENKSYSAFCINPFRK